MFSIMIYKYSDEVTHYPSANQATKQASEPQASRWIIVRHSCIELLLLLSDHIQKLLFTPLHWFPRIITSFKMKYSLLILILRWPSSFFYHFNIAYSVNLIVSSSPGHFQYYLKATRIALSNKIWQLTKYKHFFRLSAFGAFFISITFHINFDIWYKFSQTWV